MSARRQPGLTTTSEIGSDLDAVRELATLPIVVAPLRLFLVERAVSVARAATVFGVTTRTLSSWLAGNSRPSPSRGYEIALALGFDDDEQLFPMRERRNEDAR